MNLFDGVCHSFSIMGTGGYSTKQDSIAYWDSPFIEYVTSAFMVIASLNFSLLVLCLQGKFSKFFKDGETRWFLGSVCAITLLITLACSSNDNIHSKKLSARHSSKSLPSIPLAAS